MERSTRTTRKARPCLEGLEDRRLLSRELIGPHGEEVTSKDFNHRIVQLLNNVPVSDRRIFYTTPEGSRVVITLYGLGSLAGTTVNPDGSLNLVYNNTDASSRIVGRVFGGTHLAKLASIRDADANPADLIGVGAEPLNVVDLDGFDLIDGGNVNLSGGVHELILNSVGRNSQIHLRESSPPAPTTSSANQAATTSALTPGSSGGGATIVGGTVVGGTIIGGTVVGGNVGGATTTTPSTTTTAPTTGGTIGVGGATGTGTVGGTTTGGASSIPQVSVTPGASPTFAAASTTTTTVTGMDILIRHVRGAARSTPALGDAQIFGYDPVANALIRFDAVTGAPLQSISLAGSGTPIAGLGLGRDHGRLVALVGTGQSVLAFDASTGAAVGRFTTANLAALGLNTIDGIGSTPYKTVLTDSSAGALGMAVVVDVTASLDSGTAVPVGSPFVPQREFELSGGATGVAGSDTIFLAGAARFDAFQPDQTQAGVLGLSVAGSTPRETGRVALPNPKTGATALVNLGPPGTAKGNPIQALGSIDQDLALVTGVASGANTVSLLNPANLAADGSVSLIDPNRLTGLSESFHPELAGTALVDSLGNIRVFRAQDARGLVLNDSGTLNLVEIHRAADSTIVGHPIVHVAIPVRSNVQLLSSTRAFGTRGGVTVNANFKPIGPLSLP